MKRVTSYCDVILIFPIFRKSSFITEKSSLNNKRKKKIFNFLKIFYPTLVRTLHPHGQGVVGSIPVGGPVVDYELFSTVPGMNSSMCMKEIRNTDCSRKIFI